MATFKAAFKSNTVKESGRVMLKIRVTHNRDTRYIDTGLEIIAAHFDATLGNVTRKHSNAVYINAEINTRIGELQRKVFALEGRENNMNITELVDYINGTRKHGDIDFIDFARKCIAKIPTQNTQLSYNQTINKLSEYCSTSELSINTLTTTYLTDFIRYMVNHNLNATTIGIHIRNLRALFNDAIDFYNKDGQDNVIKHYPFRKLDLPKPQKRIKYVEPDSLRMLLATTFDKPRTQMAVDMFLLMFFLAGINTTDLFNMPPQTDCIYHLRQKTDQEIYLPILAPAQAIIYKYKGSEHLLCFADDAAAFTNRTAHKRVIGVYSNVHAFGRTINNELQDIASQFNLPSDITTYFARHTFATIAMQLGFGIDQIGLCLAHADGNKVTWKYIDHRKEVINRVVNEVVNYITTQ